MIVCLAGFFVLAVRACEDTPVACSFGRMTFSLPSQFELIEDTQEKIPSLIPDAKPITQYFRSYKDKNGTGFYFFYWDGYPPRDLGPMVTEQEWDITIDDSPAKLSRTKQFMGHDQKVLVVHFCDPKDDCQRYMVYFSTADGKTDPDKKAFMDVLKGIHFGESHTK